tara:strand:+ start:560 stop:766 length:207 start_codon:yes stop_codon:yes gene_type:complete
MESIRRQDFSGQLSIVVACNKGNKAWRLSLSVRVSIFKKAEREHYLEKSVGVLVLLTIKPMLHREGPR